MVKTFDDLQEDSKLSKGKKMTEQKGTGILLKGIQEDPELSKSKIIEQKGTGMLLKGIQEDPELSKSKKMTKQKGM